jgi:hypothetical protein
VRVFTYAKVPFDQPLAYVFRTPDHCTLRLGEHGWTLWCSVARFGEFGGVDLVGLDVQPREPTDPRVGWHPGDPFALLELEPGTWELDPMVKLHGAVWPELVRIKGAPLEPPWRSR